MHESIVFIRKESKSFFLSSHTFFLPLRNFMFQPRFERLIPTMALIMFEVLLLRQ